MNLQQRRRRYLPELPQVLHNIEMLRFEESKHSLFPSKDKQQLDEIFPDLCTKPLLEGVEGPRQSTRALKVGVVFSGGQAAGGHNVITGCFDALKKLHREASLLGFFNGPAGLVEGKYKKLDAPMLDQYRNQGGFDLLGSGRAKIETEQDLVKVCKVCTDLALDGLVIIGGDDSNTNAAIIAQYFLKHGCKTTVIGVPKTIDGDLSHPLIPISFGFDTAARIYSEMIGNIARDALSAKKYTHFIKLMGRSASHIALECALYCKPNLTLISEEILLKKMTIRDVVNQIADLIITRAANHKKYAVIVIPEGLIEFFVDVRELISQLNNQEILCEKARATFDLLPVNIQNQLLADRDPHGNVNVSLIETEKLLIELVTKELKERQYTGAFNPLSHFFGYEGRCGFPSYFDTHYCYALGMLAAALVHDQRTGYICSITQLTKDVSHWKVGAVPLFALMNLEPRKQKLKPVIAKALLDFHSPGPHLQYFLEHRDAWLIEDAYEYLGPIQFEGELSKREKTPQSLNY